MENKKDKLSICSLCPNKTDDWKCALLKENLFFIANNSEVQCPEGNWDKGVFPVDAEAQKELIQLGNLQSVLDKFGSVKIENVKREALSAQFKKKKLEFRPHKNLLNPGSKLEDIIHCVKNYPPGGWMPDLYKWDNVQAAYRALAAEDAARICSSEYPAERFKGKGIIVCGGGPKYFPSLYVNLRMLRLIGCTLPVEVFYIGMKEMDCRMRDILEAIDDVKCIDAVSLEKTYPIRIHGGWESKVYSIINCSFEEVLMMDADNTALVDPRFLFNSGPYKEHGAILWPDYSCWVHDKTMWKILGLEYIDEWQIESGQVMVNKKRCWNEINMAKHYCDHSDYYFKLFYGDKEAFHFGWRYFNSDYGRPPSPDWINNAVIIQRDFSGAWVFSHRAQAKFKMDKSHKICMDIPYEQDTLDLIDELKELWCGGVWMNKTPNEVERAMMDKCENKIYDYIQVGHAKRDFQLLPNHQIGKGNDRLEKHWHIFEDGDVFRMSIHGESSLTALLTWNKEENKWQGKWLDHEKFDIELVPHE